MFFTNWVCSLRYRTTGGPLLLLGDDSPEWGSLLRGGSGWDAFVSCLEEKRTSLAENGSLETRSFFALKRATTHSKPTSDCMHFIKGALRDRWIHFNLRHTQPPADSTNGAPAPAQNRDAATWTSSRVRYATLESIQSFSVWESWELIMKKFHRFSLALLRNTAEEKKRP